ncbi:serine/threonine-protein kinase [Streptantibioticus silvisoli]|uniref:non-specific serine/threonine protein kinase n=1 Tax=Streptantibioticus silvisoli TaxID=2705255 RepID=A0ABT6W987_9ACTN|nr:serine/threonine-protein kinase [Streptantibioticus silvisoli]MDI5967320.1 serine/threonine-protein kinase [Streptantibioticus silvisoli]
MATWKRPGTAVDGRLIAGRYQLAEQLGSGGMGAVWAGHDTLVRREVALKEAHFPPHLAADGKAGADRVERLLREARAAARIDHPAVVTIHDVIMHDNRPWIVMERVHGENLGQRLERQKALSQEEAARVAGAVAGALGAAHARGVLHRDVKPANVLLGPQGRVVLTDFGIAHIEGESPLTRSGEFIGSLEYIAPERMGGLKAGPPTDLWSLGVMLFEMTEGWSPFRRPTVEATVTAVLTTNVPRPVQARGLAPLITALLERNPANRPTADEAAKTLRALAHPFPAPPNTNHEAPPARPAPALRGSGPRRVPRLAVGVVAALAAVAALTPVAINELSDHGSPGSPAGATARTAAGRAPSPSPHTASLPPAAAGYVRVAEKPFTMEIPDGWQRRTPSTATKFVFTRDDCQLVVVAGRDAIGTGPHGNDPVAYQTQEEPELAAFRNSEWSSTSNFTEGRIGSRTGAQATFTWKDSKGVDVYARNTVLMVGTRFHVILVTGPDTKSGRAVVSRVASHAVQTYTPFA